MTDTTATYSYRVSPDLPLTVHMTAERQVLIMPASVPLVLTPDRAREVAALIVAAADGCAILDV